MILPAAVTTPTSPKFQTIIYLPKGGLSLRAVLLETGVSPVNRSQNLSTITRPTNFRPAMRKNQYLWHGVNPKSPPDSH